MKSLKDFWSKLKGVRHIEIDIAVLLGIVVCVCYFAFFVDKGKNDTNLQNTTQEYSSSEEYVDYLENKLCNVLSKISGVGEVSAIITLESGFSYEYAMDTETTTGSNGNSTTLETTIIIDNEPVIVKEIYPVIKGVVIVAKGSENFSIKMDILEAVTTILEIDESDITILS